MVTRKLGADIEDWTINLPDEFSTGTKVEEIVQKPAKLIATGQKDASELEFFQKRNKNNSNVLLSTCD